MGGIEPLINRARPLFFSVFLSFSRFFFNEQLFALSLRCLRNRGGFWLLSVEVLAVLICAVLLGIIGRWVQLVEGVHEIVVNSDLLRPKIFLIPLEHMIC